MEALPHSLHSWSFFPGGVFLWVTTICLKLAPWAGDCLGLPALGFLCCCSRVKVEVASVSEDACDSASVLGGSGNALLSLGSAFVLNTLRYSCLLLSFGVMFT
uniref:Uncharacterized protein n=1 Tax=Oryctolagus cuniculus TaxID=9986 RepID=A0A5F9DR55_RABIT